MNKTPFLEQIVGGGRGQIKEIGGIREAGETPSLVPTYGQFWREALVKNMVNFQYQAIIPSYGHYLLNYWLDYS